jgi:molybdate transport system permease protein
LRSNRERQRANPTRIREARFVTLLTAEEWAAFQLSLLVGVVAVVMNFPVAVWLGYRFSRKPFRIQWLIELLVHLPLVLPPVVVGYLLLVLCGRRSVIGGAFETVFGTPIVFTWLGAVLASSIVSLPLMTRSMRLAFDGVDDRLAIAARTLGASPWRVFRTIWLPLAGQGLMAAVVLGFARSLSEFGATVMIAGNIPGRTQTIPLAIYSHVYRPDGMASAWRLVFLSIVIAAVALAASESLERRRRRNASA